MIIHREKIVSTEIQKSHYSALFLFDIESNYKYTVFSHNNTLKRFITYAFDMNLEILL